MTQITLGATVKDRITGFSGVVTGIVHYLTGCHQALVAPPLGPDGAFRDSAWFDLQRLAVDALVQPVVLDNGATPGADRAPPKR
jgi:hypothetical protein